MTLRIQPNLGHNTVDLPPADILLENHGSLYILRGNTATGDEWLAANLDPDALRWGDGYVVEPRYLSAITDGALAHGLSLGG